MKKMFIKLVLFFALVALLIFTAFYSGIVVRHYTLDSKAVKDGRGMRIALISDLHGYIYGDKQDVLIKKLAGQNLSLIHIFHEQLDFMSPLVSLAPSGHTFALLAFMSAIYPTTKVVAVVQSEDGLTALRETLSEQFIPDMTLAVKNTSDVQQDPEFLSSYTALNDDDTYYVCKGSKCLSPFNGVENLSSVLYTP